MPKISPEFIQVADGTWGGTAVEIAEPVARPYVAYVAGPMTGLPNYNYDQFHAVAEHVWKHGLPGREVFVNRVEVINPARNFGGDQTLPRRVYLATAVGQVIAADALVLLPGWAQSEGAQLEVQIALNAGKDFFMAIFSELDHSWRVAPLARESVETILELESEIGNAEAERQPQPVEIEAGELVRRGARRQTYGHPRGDFDSIAMIWTGILRHKVVAEQVALCMSGLKLARLSETFQHYDSKVDSIGYVVCLDEIDGTEPSEWAA